MSRVVCQRVELVEVLLTALKRDHLLEEAVVAVDDHFGMTPLMWACLHNNLEVWLLTIVPPMASPRCFTSNPR